MQNKLFVGNLSWTTTDATLQEIFSEIGEVLEAKVIVDKFKSRSKGFGFVTMATDELAQEAMEKLNGKEVDGRAINVSIAKPPRDDGDRRGGDRNNRDGGDSFYR